ncbi:hypothetical protein HMPREF9193_01755 [Treponema lecithinolyticum ATCC 700332]|uniref:Uncharacterized protein n=1 Tax=Treponema lecithinolyticum ATCC 700332 TaxID=1321815 RepID=A0ABN0NXE1_TRELE|nr:hypothetical protein HMPREF9193_01755 [Treponema lecithinolyticum ATCC 700332]
MTSLNIVCVVFFCKTYSLCIALFKVNPSVIILIVTHLCNRA